jgi:hypothetical protein
MMPIHYAAAAGCLPPFFWLPSRRRHAAAIHASRARCCLLASADAATFAAYATIFAADTYFRRRLHHADARFSTPLDIRHARRRVAAVLRQRAIVYSFADAVFTPAAALMPLPRCCLFGAMRLPRSFFYSADFSSI